MYPSGNVMSLSRDQMRRLINGAEFDDGSTNPIKGDFEMYEFSSDDVLVIYEDTNDEGENVWNAAVIEWDDERYTYATTMGWESESREDAMLFVNEFYNGTVLRVKFR